MVNLRERVICYESVLCFCYNVLDAYCGIVMVEVNAASIGAVKHWVLFVGRQKMIDPWTGTTESTSKYPLTGYSIYHRK